MATYKYFPELKRRPKQLDLNIKPRPYRKERYGLVTVSGSRPPITMDKRPKQPSTLAAKYTKKCN